MQNENFKPYIPANKATPELTVTSILLGIILAVIFGAANAYLGLRVGMTISASIPAAVISMGVIRLVLKKDSILENNIVQTIGSAGESLAAGAIFTMPALFLWAQEGLSNKPSLITLSLISLCGGLLGVFFMVPLRNALIVKEHMVLPYPEGTACAKVLLAGEEGGSNAATVFAGMGLAAIVKMLVDGIKIIPGVITAKLKLLKSEFSTEVYPALLGVGYICGPKISSYMFAGGIFGWFVLIPAIVTFGANTVSFPASDTIGAMYAANGASAIWSSYIRYIGAGAVAAGGIISLIKTLPLIAKAFYNAMICMNAGTSASTLRTEKELNFRFVLFGIAILTLIIWLTPVIPVGLLGALIILAFGFFFATVSCRMVGLVGSSNNPVSGMVIATLLITSVIFKLTGQSDVNGMISAITIGSIICIISSMAGDTSQDLKTGYLLGATPKMQQIGEIIGTSVAALAIGGVLMLLDQAWGFGSTELSAPQATLMKMIIEGVMHGNLPWALLFIGVFVACFIEILGIPILPVAIGLYLPLELSAPIMVGGAIRYFVDKCNEANEAQNSSSGILFCSGLIAGEGLVGILLAILAISGVDNIINLSAYINLGLTGSILVLVILIACIAKSAFSKVKKRNKS